MKLVLIPGLDGTGALFEPVLQYLGAFDVTTIRLPESGPQDYLSLTEFVQKRLPDRPFILLAESFSGPIAMELAAANKKTISALILVASFLSPPHATLLSAAKWLPFKMLMKLPFSGYFQRLLFLGKQSDQQLLELFAHVVGGLSSGLIRQRIEAIKSLKPKAEAVDIPTLYLQATDDYLVPEQHGQDVECRCSNLKQKRVGGPHFLLQSNPKKCAEIISDFAGSLGAPL